MAALFAAIGIIGALSAGAAIGAISGHLSGAMDRVDLKELGDALDEGEAGLIVVYAMNMADQIAANIKAADRIVSKATGMSADAPAQNIKDARDHNVRTAGVTQRSASRIGTPQVRGPGQPGRAHDCRVRRPGR